MAMYKMPADTNVAYRRLQAKFCVRTCYPSWVRYIVPTNDYGHVWFSFFLTSFSENLAVGRIWLWGESEYHYNYVEEDKVFHRAQDLKSDRFLLLQ
jgi:hypothetical protein